MSTIKPLPRGLVTRTNSLVERLRRSRVFGPAMSRTLTTISYTGRRSGRTFSIPVGYRRQGDVITIGVAMPDRKRWWRNFLGEPGPIMIELDGRDRPGQAVARRDARGRVTVTVQLAQE
ncbi:MAG TPA: hypothetical protein VK020_16515 [Microlunatus sp.]|nr:hypothetical protein [Microlunatus sp.]